MNLHPVLIGNHFCFLTLIVFVSRLYNENEIKKLKETADTMKKSKFNPFSLPAITPS